MGYLMKKLLSVILSAGFLFTSFAYDTPVFSGEETWSHYNWRNDNQFWVFEKSEEVAKDLNEGNGRYQLEYKRKGGSSAQLLVKDTETDSVIGLFSAPNHATYTLTETFTYNLSRYLDKGHWTGAATRMTLVGPGYDQAKREYYSQVQSTRACNLAQIKGYFDYFQGEPGFLTGIFVPFGNEKPEDLQELVVSQPVTRTNKLNTNDKLRSSHFLTKYVEGRADQKPTDRIVYFVEEKKYVTVENADGTTRTRKFSWNGLYRNPSTKRLLEAKNYYLASEIELVKQLSFMMLVDALSGQRDRFGTGNNMQVFVAKDRNAAPGAPNGTFFLSAIDNGGGSDNPKSSRVSKSQSLKYFLGELGGPGIQRFEREIFNKMRILNSLLEQEERDASDADVQHSAQFSEIAKSLGYEKLAGDFGPKDRTISQGVCDYDHGFLFAPYYDLFEARFRNFKYAVKLVWNHMEAVYEKDGEDTFID